MNSSTTRLTTPESPFVIQVIKSLSGGAQSRLVQCDDGKFYVLKMHPNPQGPNVLANEALGACLLRGLGFLVPDWKPITINLKTLPFFPDLIMDLAERRTLPSCGVHFGSEYLGGDGSHLFDFIPESYKIKVKNADQLADIHIFDLWANHLDQRQCVYRKAKLEEPYEAFFIDNGHLFGGPHWSEDSGRAVRSFAFDFSPSSLRDPRTERWLSFFEGVVPTLLRDAFEKIPPSWYRGDAECLQAGFSKRLRGLRRLLHQTAYLQSRGCRPWRRVGA